MENTTEQTVGGADYHHKTQSTEDPTKYGQKSIEEFRTEILAKTQRYSELIKSYIDQAIDNGSPIVIDTDRIRDILGDPSWEQHFVCSDISHAVYIQALARDTHPVVKFTVGGPGSGKTEVILNNLPKDYKGIVVDSPSSHYNVTTNKILLAIQAGKEPEFYMVLPNIEKARQYSLMREKQTGRTVPLKYFINKHREFVKTWIRLLQENPDLKVALKDLRDIHDLETARETDYTTDHKQILTILESLNYDKDELYAKLKAIDDEQPK